MPRSLHDRLLSTLSRFAFGDGRAWGNVGGNTRYEIVRTGSCARRRAGTRTTPRSVSHDDRLSWIHADPADADLIKRGKWDIPVNTVEDLREWLFEQQISVEAFKKLDVYVASVEGMPWLAEL